MKEQNANENRKQTAANALLLTTPGCVHCAALKKILDKLLDEDVLARLDVIDVSQQPEYAEKYHVKSAPWLKLGNFQFQGKLSEKELRDWVGALNSPQGHAEYLKYVLSNGQLDLVIRMMRNGEQQLPTLLSLIKDTELDYKVRLGISAVFEELEGTNILKSVVDPLGELIRHDSPQVRADTAHFLALTHSYNAIPYLQKLAMDENSEVREIADDALGSPTV
jgi:glutaredoxin